MLVAGWLVLAFEFPAGPAAGADLELNQAGDQADCTVGVATFGDIRFSTTISGSGARPGVTWRGVETGFSGPTTGVIAPPVTVIPGLTLDSRIPRLPGQGNPTVWTNPKAAWYFNNGQTGALPVANDPVALINGYYRRWLGRDVDPGEVAAGLDAFTRSGVTEDQINATFQNSTEYKVRQILLQAGMDRPERQRATAGAVERGEIPRPGYDLNAEVEAYAQGNWP